MKIIFVSTMCSQKHYEEICKNRKIRMLDSSQKFFDMFVNGFKGRNDVEVVCVSIPPVSHQSYPQLYIAKRTEQVDNITYFSVPCINYIGMKSFFAQYWVRRYLEKEVRCSKEETIIITDPLLLEGSIPALEIGKKYRVPVVGFLTDLPQFADECDIRSLPKKLLYRLYNRKSQKCLAIFDRYIFLTEAMNTVVNKKHRPWMLMECLVDPYETGGVNTCKKYSPPHVMYAGKLHREFGLDILMAAIPLVKTECVFDIYGDGNYLPEIKEMAKKLNNVVVHEIIPVKAVMNEERKCTLLINPRPSTGKFTEYSFPSKTAEYMLSGTPVLMFKLPGIPKEYDPYLYYAPLEEPQSIADAIDKVLCQSERELNNFGKLGKQFICTRKNNRVQAQRFLDFMNRK